LGDRGWVSGVGEGVEDDELIGGVFVVPVVDEFAADEACAAGDE
jgi:hypothetical protein